MPEIIDWLLPLETDEPTPRKATLVRVEPPTIVAGGVYVVRTPVDVYTYFSGGKPMRPAYPKIRNVRALRTSDECLQRMEALVRRMAGDPLLIGFADAYVAATEIVKLLPAPPVDPDLIEARKITDGAAAIRLDGIFPDLHGKTLDAINDAVLRGVKRGRELAHAEYTLGPPPGPNDDFLTYRRKLAAKGQ